MGRYVSRLRTFISAVFNPQRPDADRTTTFAYDSLGRVITTTTNIVDGNPLSGSADSDRVQGTRYDLARAA